jgi:RimJ/RimL family protein N-acetyltransferase
MDAPDRTTLADAWPIFGLRIRTERLELRLPTDDEILALIDVAKAGIHPPEEMPFGVAFTDPPSPEFEQGFVQHHWSIRGNWTPDAWQLNLGVFHDGSPMGSQSIHGKQFAVYRTVDTGSWLGAAFQGRGFGKEMRTAVLAFAFDGLGARYAESGAFTDNDRSNAVSRALGYEENGRAELAPRGEPRPTINWRMSAETWRSRERPPVTTEGLEACRQLFGA